jgi:phospholipid/cholesterol/gamma-HCH transport system ATP-binding protein
MPERKAVGRRQARVREIMHTLPPAAQEAIRIDLDRTPAYAPGEDYEATARHRNPAEEEAPTASIPLVRE